MPCDDENIFLQFTEYYNMTCTCVCIVEDKLPAMPQN